jgi:hypothetical protein
MLVLILIGLVVVALAHGKNGLNCLGGVVRLVFGLMLLLVAASMI